MSAMVSGDPASSKTSRAEGQNASWGAVCALSLGAFALVSSEFMPVSLLTPIASDLNISEGQAGQAISVAGAFALLTSLFVSSLVGRLDRKILLLGLTALMILSGSVVAAAPSYGVLMIGRALIGISIGGFWSMLAATAMRLVPGHQVPKALAILNGGNALASVIAAPVGSFLGDLVGWRWAFFSVVPIGAIVLVWQLLTLPSMKVHAAGGSSHVFPLLQRRVVAFGMAGVSLLFMGQFALFTYLRPYLETVVHVDVPTFSFMLLIMGVAGFVGTTLIGAVLKSYLYLALLVAPLVMALIALALAVMGGSASAVAVLLAVWGLVATSAPVGWWTWLSKTLPRDAEAGGGLMVATIQLAITLGATIGGFLFDSSGYTATFGMSAALLALAGIFAVMAARATRSH